MIFDLIMIPTFGIFIAIIFQSLTTLERKQMAKIDPKILKKLRNQHSLSQQALADTTQGRNRVGIATIKRIEAANEVYDAQQRVAKGLAKALRVKIETLSGEVCNQEELNQINRVHGYQEIKFRIDASNAFSYDMVEHLYGIPVKSQIELAPLFIALMAEGSFTWRREKLAALDESVEKLESVATSAGHLVFAFCWDLEDGIACENESINERDLFGRNVSDRAYDKSYDPHERNPFLDYLKAFAAQVKSDDINIMEEMEDYLPWYRIGEREIEELFGDSEEAQYAITKGHIRIKDIPKDLLEKNKKEERIQWIDSNMPDKAREGLKEMKEFEKLLFGH